MGHTPLVPLEVVCCERLPGNVVTHYLLQTSEAGSEKKGDQLSAFSQKVGDPIHHSFLPLCTTQFYTQAKVKEVDVGRLIHDRLSESERFCHTRLYEAGWVLKQRTESQRAHFWVLKSVSPNSGI